MEADIILEGFLKCEKTYGIRYKKFIGDGDSNVYKKLLENVQYNGKSVQKIECANHCCRNYTGGLHKVAANTSYPATQRRILKQRIPRLTAAARGAIRQNSDTKNVNKLRDDLRNGQFHVFGDHSKCPRDDDSFCKRHDNQEPNFVLEFQKSGFWLAIVAELQRLLNKSASLVENATSNLAESLMNVVAKYNCGKRLNFCRRGSFQRRCYIAGESFTKGPLWHRSPWKKLTGQSPGKFFKQNMERKVKAKSAASKKLHFRKFKMVKTTTKESEKSYGINSDQPDIDDEDLKKG